MSPELKAILKVRINSYSSGLLSRRELTAQCARLTNEQKVPSIKGLINLSWI